jgi:hypothetical protein
VPVAITGLDEQFAAELETAAANLRIEGYNNDAVESFVPPDGFLKVDCSQISESGEYVLSVLAGTLSGLSFSVDPREVKIQISSAEEAGDESQ